MGSNAGSDNCTGLGTGADDVGSAGGICGSGEAGSSTNILDGAVDGESGKGLG